MEKSYLYQWTNAEVWKKFLIQYKYINYLKKNNNHNDAYDIQINGIYSTNTEKESKHEKSSNRNYIVNNIINTLKYICIVTYREGEDKNKKLKTKPVSLKVNSRDYPKTSQEE